jgi:hypothetical protein
MRIIDNWPDNRTNKLRISLEGPSFIVGQGLQGEASIGRLKIGNKVAIVTYNFIKR